MKDGASPGGSETDLGGVPIALLGLGAVGQAFATELAHAGADLRLWSRTRPRLEPFARGVGARVFPGPAEAARGARLVLLTVADEALPDVARASAAALLPERGEPAWIHTNGSHGLQVLAPLAERGFGVGKLHPLVALSAGGAPGGLRGAWFATAGTGTARPWIERLVRLLGGRELPIGAAEASSRRLHAAAALLSGGLVALLDAAREVALDEALDPAALDGALRSLLRSTAANLESLAPREALTGPVARGSVELVRGHLELLERADPALARLYRVLGARMLALARARGGLDAGALRALTELFAERAQG